MDILTANQTTTTNFAVTIEGINAKYKKEKEDLKKIIAETARSQAEEILADDDDDSMGNPEELCQKLAELRLQYNSIVVKQKQEMDAIMKAYNSEIFNNMGTNLSIAATETLNKDDKIRLEVYDKYIGTHSCLSKWYKWHPKEHYQLPGWTNKQHYNFSSPANPDIWFQAFKIVIQKRIIEKGGHLK